MLRMLDILGKQQATTVSVNQTAAQTGPETKTGHNEPATETKLSKSQRKRIRKRNQAASLTKTILDTKTMPEPAKQTTSKEMVPVTNTIVPQSAPARFHQSLIDSDLNRVVKKMLAECDQVNTTLNSLTTTVRFLGTLASGTETQCTSITQTDGISPAPQTVQNKPEKSSSLERRRIRRQNHNQRIERYRDSQRQETTRRRHQARYNNRVFSCYFY